MLQLPKSTEFNRRIPKQKFYENLSITPELKRLFVEQINAIYWANKLATTTLNLEQGKEVHEVEVFEIRLNQPELDQRVLQLIDREIPYHILFVLNFEEHIQLWIGYKEASNSKPDIFKVSSYYHTDWDLEKPLHLGGLNMDSLYSGLVRQVAGEHLQVVNTEGSAPEVLRQAVARDEERQALERKISQLEAKVHKEKQFNKRVELNTELKRLRKFLKELLG